MGPPPGEGTHPTTRHTTRRRFVKTAAGIGVASTVGVGGAGTARASSGDPVWTFPTGDIVFSSPTVIEGTVYVGSFDANAYALDATTGDEHWRFETAASVFSSPTVVDGRVHLGDGNGNVYAVEADTGTEGWRFETDGPVISSPTVYDGTVYLGSNDNHVYAFDAETGEVRWRVETDGSVASSPTMVDGTVFVGSVDATIYALDAATGDSRWQFEAGGPVRSSPTVADGTVYVGSDNNRVYALDAETGDERWHFDTHELVFLSPAVADGTVYVGSVDANLYALDARDGGQRWRFETDAPVTSSPTVADGTVYVGSNDNHLYALDAVSGEQRWRFETDDFVRSSPTVVDGIVYVGSYDARVYALDAGIGGSSDDSRVSLGTLGHHEAWAGVASALHPASFAVEITETNEPEAGDDLAVTVVITNTGDRTGTQTVHVDVAGLGSTSVTVTLDGGVSTTETAALATVQGDSGQYSISVSSDDDAATATVSVVEPAVELEETVASPTTEAMAQEVDDADPFLISRETILGVSAAFLTVVGGYVLYSRWAGPDVDEPEPEPAADREPTGRSTLMPSDGPPPAAPTVPDGPASGVEDLKTRVKPPTDDELHADDRIPTEIPSVPTASLSYDDITKESPIGSGGQADVYRATAPTDEGPLTIALKEPRLGGMEKSDTIQGLVRDEAEVWHKLDDHDHIVSVVDYGTEPVPWIAMEYMDGGDLRDRAGEMGLKQALWTAIATTEAVRHAHRRGVAHLDLKPQNILFRSVEDAWDVPKVADWGLSKLLLEHSQSVKGMSPHYSAPEQFEPSYGTADDFTDVFQLGMVFYVLFTGRLPFEGRPVQIMHQVLNEQPVPPSEVAAVPSALDDIILTAMATEKRERYEAVIYLRDELQALFESI